MLKTIFVRYEFEWIHQWKDAPEQVEFLKNLHRHKFNIEIEFKVNHNDRDLEFFIMKKKIWEAIRYLYQMNKVNFLYEVESCEQVAQDLLEYFDPEYEVIWIEVNEDWENGARLYYK